ncbi:serum opacification factor [Streptococcus canis]|uniref:serum opacification factor n=1 Tax=Streptococcus canis TaxID=1329 RepID=UPI0013305666|nr:serum opacification factor [Streptococcus canis]
MSDCKYKLRKLSVGLVSVGTMFTATTVMGNEVSQPTTTEVTTSPVAVESSSTSTTPSESPMTEAQTPTTATKAETGGAQPEPTKVESEQVKDEKTSETTASSQEESQSPKATPRSKRSVDSAPEQPQLMEVETITVDKEKTELNLKDGNGNKKLIKNRDGEQREIVDISREVKVDESKNELEVTLTVTPKEIDKGAEVIILLDTSKKMTEEDFDTAKENIKKLVTTLTSKSDNDTPNYNSRNSVRLISFYRKINEPISLTANDVESKLNEIWNTAKNNWDWGVDLQGAIHKAREIFNKEKKSGKRQHIVLFSQGEATFSYDIKDKSKLSKTTVKEPITSSNPLLTWPFYFDSTANVANLVEDGKRIQGFLKKLGIPRYQDLLDEVASQGNTFLNIGSTLLGTNNPLDYITLSDLNTKNLTEKEFDYSKILGEGYNFRSYYTRESGKVPLESIVKKAVKSKIEKLKKRVEKDSWFDVLGLTKWSDSISKALGFDQVEEQMINKVVDYLFYKRDYIYYNHNLSAQAEAKMARDEGITFYAFDVTDPHRAAKRAKRAATNDHDRKKEEEAKALYKKRNEKFDKYLKAMSDGQDFLKRVEDKDKFQDILDEVTVTETFEDKVTVADQWKAPSHYKNSNGGNQTVKYTSSSSSWLGNTKESLTWTISKDELKNAFENEKPLTLTYKLKVNKDKIKVALSKTRKKRSATTQSDDLLTESIISNKNSYKINKKSANGQKLDDVTLTYSKVMIPVPEIEIDVIKPQVPQSPEKPLVVPMMPLYPAIPFVPETPNNDGLEISGGSSEIDIVEDTDSGIESGAANGAISIQENTDPLVEITVDTQPGMSGQSEIMTTIEDTKTEETDAIIGGNVIDITEDSITDNQHTESGENSTDHNQEIIEDTKPESDTISVGGQSDPIDITEDTLSNLSGQSNNDATDDTIIEDTRQTDVIIGGQANSVDMVEETQPGMSGFNEATVVEEDTRPKLQFHFDNEDPISAINQAISQTPVTRADNNLPQTGDKDTLEAFFTITALTVIGAAGLLSKKDRKNQIN